MANRTNEAQRRKLQRNIRGLVTFHFLLLSFNLANKLATFFFQIVFYFSSPNFFLTPTLSRTHSPISIFLSTALSDCLFYNFYFVKLSISFFHTSCLVSRCCSLLYLSFHSYFFFFFCRNPFSLPQY